MSFFKNKAQKSTKPLSLKFSWDTGTFITTASGIAYIGGHISPMGCIIGGLIGGTFGCVTFDNPSAAPQQKKKPSENEELFIPMTSDRNDPEWLDLGEGTKLNLGKNNQKNSQKTFSQPYEDIVPEPSKPYRDCDLV
ncbi:MAG: hypothetical protein K9G62_07025 [Alphaproteobacteria bacterium]|nr:hypothetical protein [Alphaproteobacteria bacterium]